MKIILLIMIGFSLSIANVVVDKETGLMWQDNYEAKSVTKTWSGAKQYCKDLTLKDYSDWFLPTHEQLQTITDKSQYNPAIDKQFKNVISSYYWSSSSDVSNSSDAWYVYFKDGGSDGYDKANDYYVRCARAGQSDTLNFDRLVSALVQKELQAIVKPKTSIELVRDEFETSGEFKRRVSTAELSQKRAIAKYKKNYASAKQKAKKDAIKKALEIRWGKPLLSKLRYDADNGYFVADISFEAKNSFKKKVAIKVERKNARAFKKNFATLKPQAIFEYDGSSVRLKEIKVPYASKKYIALFTDMNINETRVAVNISNDIGLVDSNFASSSITVGKSSVASLDTSRLTNYSELDTLLKKSKQLKRSHKKWLFVVGIEKYQYTDNISYATRSAEMFTKTAQKRLGIFKENSYVLLNANATQAEIKTKMRKMLRRVKKGDTIYFYYNGHGIPIPSMKNEPFMLASNSEPDYIADESFFSLKNIYAKLSDSKAKKIVVFVDSCFSGVTDGKAVLKGVAATKMVAKSVKFDKKKMVVLSAGKGNQYSNGYNRKGHRLFSFYVMKNIIQGDKDIKTLYKHTKSQTYDTSIEEYGDSRTQEPTIEGNYRMSL